MQQQKKNVWLSVEEMTQGHDRELIFEGDNKTYKSRLGFTYKNVPLYMWRFKEVSLIGRHPIIFDEKLNGNFADGLSHMGKDHWSQFEFSDAQPLSRSRVNFSGNDIHYYVGGHHNFGHNLLEYFSRSPLAPMGSSLILNEYTHDSSQQLLSLLDQSFESVKRINPSVSNFFNELLFPECAIRRDQMGQLLLNTNAVTDFRDRVLSNSLVSQTIRKSSTNRRIFATRSGAKTRNLLNQDEIIAYLSRAGFEIIDFSNHSFIDQVSMAYTAEVLISPAGASNCISMFCSSGTSVIELCPPVSFFGMYNGIVTSEIFGQKFSRVSGQTYSQSPNISSDYFVPLHSLFNLLRRV